MAAADNHMAAAWDAAVEVTAAVYRADPALLRAESRGRGPKPPKAIWEAKKLAIYVAVAVAGCDYAALARHVGLHKDTVTSHCASVRDQCATDGAFEARADALVEAAMHRTGRAPALHLAPIPDDVTLAAMWLAIDGRLARIETAVLSLARPHPSPSDEMTVHPTEADNHATVIEMPSKRARSAA